jgi:hypothetical protein
MSFLQPLLLAALPLVALPIIIHLINQRRYQTIRWGAMMFLLAASRMSRGFARLRQWLIMAFRMAAIAGLIFAISRPLAGGWLGLAAGGRPETTIVLLDRSPSMQQKSPTGAGASKLQTGLRQLVLTLQTIGSSRWVLIESTRREPIELESIDELLTSPSTGPSSASADLPAMLLAAREYVKANKSGRTEIWICSDIRQNDWNSESGRWQAIRDGFSELAQTVRFHLLAYPQIDPENISVRVTDARRQQTPQGAELLVSLRLMRGNVPGHDKRTIPVQLEIDGARFEVAVDLVGSQSELLDHKIPLEKGRLRGWGRVSIPADSNPADNDFYFVWEESVARKTMIVSDDPQAARPLVLAASIAPLPGLRSSAEIVAPAQAGALDFDQVSLLIWHAPLPEGDAARQVAAFINRGGAAIFFPPRAPGGTELFGVRWTAWADQKAESAIESWRGDEDLLAHTQSGMPLPVGELQVRRYCGLLGELTPLAAIRGGAPLLGRATTDRGAAYFCATTPAPGDSSLATGGVVFYVMVQRALVLGSAALGSTRQLTAGEVARDDPQAGRSEVKKPQVQSPGAAVPKVSAPRQAPAALSARATQPAIPANQTIWTRVVGGDEAISTEFAFHRGVYLSGDRMLAVNRSAAEDQSGVLPDARVAALFRGLDFARVDDRAGNIASLIQEIWRFFLLAMLSAMVVEALLCMPKPLRPRTSGATP